MRLRLQCPRIVRGCLTAREFTTFQVQHTVQHAVHRTLQEEFRIDIRATVVAMEDVCPIAKALLTCRQC